MPGPLSAERPGPDAYTTRQEGTWDEPSKDAIGVYRGKSKSRDEHYDKSTMKVGVAVPRPKAMGQPPAGISNLHGKAVFAKRRKRK
jgi:hypothetical protein